MKKLLTEAGGVGIIVSLFVIVWVIITLPIRIMVALLLAPGPEETKTVRTVTKRRNHKGEETTTVSVRRTSST